MHNLVAAIDGTTFPVLHVGLDLMVPLAYLNEWMAAARDVKWVHVGPNRGLIEDVSPGEGGTFKAIMRWL